MSGTPKKEIDTTALEYLKARIEVLRACETEARQYAVFQLSQGLTGFASAQTQSADSHAKEAETLEAILTRLTAPAPTVPTCQTCPHFVKVVGAACTMLRLAPIPADGSGYCHLHPDAPKETR